MVILLIHWKIRPDPTSVQAFRKWWKDHGLPNPGNFSGEYLSEPLTRDVAGFPCTTFNMSTDARFRSFFNIAIWKDQSAFRRDVIDRVVEGHKEMEDFEFDHRERMVLEPLMSRPGKLPLPDGPGLVL